MMHLFQRLRSRRVRLAWCFCAIAIGLLTSTCQADLYTASAASLEWKVDSADEVFLATVVQDGTAKFGLRFEPKATLKANRPLDSFPHESVHHCRLGGYLNPAYHVAALGTEWLLFVRGAGERARISNAIYLSHPHADWVTAAITATGEGDERVVGSWPTIIEHVKSRIAKNVRLPSDCEADLTDQLLSRSIDGFPLGGWLGGKLLKADINVWDRDNGYGQDFDTWINYLLVPEDVPPINARDELSRKTLRNIDMVGMSEAAASVLKYSDLETNQSPLVGTWFAEYEDHSFTVTLQPRHTLLYLVEPKPGHELPALPQSGGKGFGAGYWETYGNSLRLHGTHYIQVRKGRPTTWTAGGAALPRSKVLQITNTAFRLAEGTTFVRRNGPLKVSDHPHEHPWYLVPEDLGSAQ